MNKENVEAVKGRSKYILQRISPYKKAIITIGAIGLTLALAIFGGIKLTSVNKNAFSINLADYDRIVRIDSDLEFCDPVTEKFKSLDWSQSVSLSYNLTSSDDVELHVHPNNATLIDDNPEIKYATDKIFEGCQNALIYNFGDEMEQIKIDAVDTARVSQFNDLESARQHTMYKVLSDGKGILVAGHNFVPYRQISETEAKQSQNLERFTTAHIRIGNKITNFDNFIGINSYEQDNVKLLGIVMMDSDNNYYEYFVSSDQYALEGQYDASELEEIQETDKLFEMGSVFIGMLPTIDNVYIVDRPILLDLNDMQTIQSDSVVYLRTKDNRVIKTQRGNVFLLKQKDMLDDSKATGDTEYGVIISYDSKVIGASDDGKFDISQSDGDYARYDAKLYGSDFYENSEYSLDTITYSYVHKAQIENDGWIMSDTPTTASINLPNYAAQIPIIGYKINVGISYDSKNNPYQYAESISVMFRTNNPMYDMFSDEVFTCYDLPIEAVMLASVDLEAGYQTPVSVK
jgi:hypothetical protein